MTDRIPPSPESKPSHDPTHAHLTRAAHERGPSSRLSGLEVARVAATLASEKKAEEVLILDVSGVCGYADYFVIASAPSERQSMAIARTIDDGLRRGGIKPMSVEGMRQGNWVLIDVGDVVVHCFLTGARDYYDLEGFWTDGKRVAPDEEVGAELLRSLGLNRFGEYLPGHGPSHDFDDDDESAMGSGTDEDPLAGEDLNEEEQAALQQAARFADEDNEAADGAAGAAAEDESGS